jgi:tetrachloro-p-hydroquinone reductive dehalogenase
MSRETESQEPILYHAPPSFYSQLARLALAEAHFPHRKVVVVPGPPSFESYEPWYMEKNPGGTVPTLEVNGKIFDDSRDILNAAVESENGGHLRPEILAASVDEWVEKAYGIPEREVAYSSAQIKKVGRVVNGARRRALAKNKARHPDLAGVYQAKIADIDAFMSAAADAENAVQIRAQTQAALDEANRMLEKSPWLCGNVYTLADLVWTVTVARQFVLGAKPLDGRPHLADWYGRVKARPSFVEGDVWDRFKPSALIKVMAKRYGLRVAVGLSLLGAAAWAAWRQLL